MPRSAPSSCLTQLCALLTQLWAVVLIVGTVAMAGGLAAGDIGLGSAGAGGMRVDNVSLSTAFLSSAQAQTMVQPVDAARAPSGATRRLIAADSGAPAATGSIDRDKLALPSAYSRPDASRKDLTGQDDAQRTLARPELAPRQEISRQDLGLETPDSARPRAHGVYAPYLATPQVGDGDLDPKALLDSLEARGFTDLSRPVLRGRTYICEATGPRRERVRLLVDADSGVIIGLSVLGYDSRSSVSTP